VIERNISETPDRWVILKITHPDLKESIYKVFGSWSGGYIDSDRWKLNSGIKSVEKDGDYFYFVGYSGSCYKCHKLNYGVATSYSLNKLDEILKHEGVDQLTEEEAFKHN